jgi:hypothetical protein
MTMMRHSLAHQKVTTMTTTGYRATCDNAQCVWWDVHSQLVNRPSTYEYLYHSAAASLVWPSRSNSPSSHICNFR